MKLLYLDSSAFVKLYLAEAESEKVEELLGEFPTLASSAIAYAEVCGAFAVRFHRGDLGEEEYRAARLAFHNDWAKVHVCELEPPISLLAADIMKAHKGLRAMDALHLAAALALRQSVSLRFVTFDAKLEHAAKKLMSEAAA
ncbi:type II toxin-antitoxin system VapC family toxin [Deinococcus antarcticus]|uniref:Ribonuclease VapC n=1 Tax=Deinococcus antarcticus TaxID=1298767 RepID=A0ABV8A9E0_9DEIO